MKRIFSNSSGAPRSFTPFLAVGLLTFSLLAWFLPAGLLAAPEELASPTITLELLEDPASALTIAQVVEADRQGRFSPSSSSSPSLGFTRSAIWAKLRLNNPFPTPRDFFLEIAYPHLDQVDLYLPDPGGGFTLFRSGDHVPLSQRPVSHHNPVFPIRMDSNGSLTCYLRVATTSSLNLPILFLTPERFAERTGKTHALLGIYFGILLVMLLHNLFIFLNLRDKTFLFYVLLVGAYLAFQLCLSGYAQTYFLPEAPGIADKGVPVTLFTAYFLAILFSRAILATSRYTPRFDKILLLLMNLALFGLATALFTDYSMSIRLGTALSATLLFLLGPALIGVYHGHRPARYYLAAWTVSLLGVGLYILKSFGLLPYTFLTNWGIQVGSAWEVILLSLGLADRYYLLKKKQEDEQAALAEQLKAANRELERFNEELEDLVEARTEELSTLNEELRREIEERREAEERAAAANQAKSQFLANMSHEIRTPLNSILGMANLAAKQDLPPKLRQYIEIIRDSGDSLLGLINDILDFSKIEAGKLDMEEVSFDLVELLDNVVDMFSRRIAEKGIELVVLIHERVPNALVGDPLRLKQILTNLVNNAIKFTDQGEIVISVNLLERREGKAVLEFLVDDTGNGMNHDQVKRIFGEFTQADRSTARLYGGTGLGLAISKRLVEMMHGEISAESAEGVGSTFRFTVEISMQHEEMQRSLKLPPQLEGKRVLVAEPNDTLCHALVSTLRAAGIHALPCQSLAEAEAILERPDCPYDAAVINWRFPDGEGIRLIEKLRANPQRSEFPLLFMLPIGYEDLSIQVESGQAGVVLEKPVKPSALLYHLANLLAPGSLAARPVSVDAPGFAADRVYFRGARVLVVEDDPVNQEVSRKLLNNRGIEADIAANGREAIEKLERTAYDAVLMDVQMPVMDGFEATRAIRSMERFRKLPIIAMTAYAMKGDKERCIEAGMNDYIHKPLDFDLLFATLRKWISPASLRKQQPPDEAP